ncbi:MAG TPA: DUF1501 domain-containing protein, partial [Bacteroidia bacterium]|nr:DUF1501 domain-containing protein [Bacteroidia bacterium]
FGVGRNGLYAPSASTTGKRLVVIQLSGGNDGLNCVVPFRNDLYYQARPSLGLKDDDIIKITDEVALNSSLQGLADLFNNGNLAIINSVGYPNPNRSHFRSMDIWQTASDENQYLYTGWVGRYLDATCNGTCAKPYNAIEIDDTLSLALKGDIMKGLAFSRASILHSSAQNPIIRGVANDYKPNNDHPEVEYLQKTLAETMESADYIYAHSKTFKSQRIYPANNFGNRLKTISELICSGCDSSIYYISLPGFDTHVAQKGQQKRALKSLSDGLAVFCQDLKENDKFNDTVIMTFSEFGRRVAQNASLGTDHGTANNIYVIGGKLAKPGIYNPMADLQNLDDGDLIYTTDFRQVYATMLDKVLGVDSEKVLGKKFDLMNFV